MVFDPCLDIPDEVMIDADYDAAHKEAFDMPMGLYTFLGCRYRGTFGIPGELRRYTLSILAGNVTLDEERNLNGHLAVPIEINGRQGLREPGAVGADQCSYVLGTGFGIVIFNRLYNRDHAREIPMEKWCAGMDEFVAAVEPYIAD